MTPQTTAAVHPLANELADFAVGALDETRAAVIEGHVYRCNRCAQVVANIPDDGFLAQLRSSHLAAGNGANDGSAPEPDGVGVQVADTLRTELPPELRNHPRYEIRRLIAEGAMGRVYLAVRHDQRQWVAVKVIRPNLAGDPRKVSRFLQEARVAGKLRHPNIAQVVDCESVGGTAFIALEYVRGRTLAQIVAQRGPLPVAQAIDCVRQTAAGLVHAAEQNVVHRDIKPHNLMLETHGRRVKIVDFGLGRLVESQRDGSRITREGEILGTLDYISPEQAANSRDADMRSDIYSLGCTFYYLLAGAPPFRGKNAVDMLLKHESERPAAIRSLRPDVPEAVAALIDRMMEKDPNVRPQSPQQVLEGLNRVDERFWPGHTPSSDRAPHDHGTQPANSNPLRLVTSPLVWLPTLTCLVCLLWLWLR